jgi:hypothetical protein
VQVSHPSFLCPHVLLDISDMFGACRLDWFVSPLVDLALMADSDALLSTEQSGFYLADEAVLYSRNKTVCRGNQRNRGKKGPATRIGKLVFHAACFNKAGPYYGSIHRANNVSASDAEYVGPSFELEYKHWSEQSGGGKTFNVRKTKPGSACSLEWLHPDYFLSVSPNVSWAEDLALEMGFLFSALLLAGFLLAPVWIRYRM